MTAMDTETERQSLFRPVKRRKFQRRRPEDTSGRQETQSSTADLLASQCPRHDSNSAQTSPILRRLHRSRKGGIEFSNTSRPTADQLNQTSKTIRDEMESERLRTMGDRFTAHTGQTVDADKHMMAYIEAEMAKRYRPGIPGDALSSESAALHGNHNPPPTSDLPEREPATLGKLHEIDLGREAKLHNIVRTEEATRRLNSDGNSADRSPCGGSRYRLLKDIERDQLVEEVLRESKLDVYDGIEDEVFVADDQAADDRVAEQFRREFLDAIQSRRRVARTKVTKQPGKTEAPKGPKLGGSRSARAAMREMQEKGARK